MTSHLDPKWIWRCRFYYAEGVKLPRQAGELAIETVHANDTSKDIEVMVGQKRPDIGRIDVDRIGR